MENSEKPEVILIKTKEQQEAYDEFIDYMVELYNKYSYLVEER